MEKFVHENCLSENFCVNFGKLNRHISCENDEVNIVYICVTLWHAHTCSARTFSYARTFISLSTLSQFEWFERASRFMTSYYENAIATEREREWESGSWSKNLRKSCGVGVSVFEYVVQSVSHRFIYRDYIMHLNLRHLHQKSKVSIKTTFRHLFGHI